MSAEVWVLDFEAADDDGSEFDGWRSVHASRDGATARLVDRLHAIGIDIGRTSPADLGGVVHADNGSYAGDVDICGVAVSYGVHRMPIEP